MDFTSILVLQFKITSARTLKITVARVKLVTDIFGFIIQDDIVLKFQNKWCKYWKITGVYGVGIEDNWCYCHEYSSSTVASNECAV